MPMSFSRSGYPLVIFTITLFSGFALWQEDKLQDELRN